MTAEQDAVVERPRKLEWTIKRRLGKVGGSIVPIPSPEVVSGAGALKRIGEVAKERGIKKPLIVTDAVLVKLGVAQSCVDSLTAAGLSSALFDAVVPNPHSELVEDGYKLYQEQGCDGIIAIGGGSPMDCAKTIAAKVANPLPVKEYQGFLKVSGPTGRHASKLPPVIAVPTTAGTGSETTIVAIISITAERAKIAIGDPNLVPKVAVLDPELIVGLPKEITAATGMDAMTHAMESYLSAWANEFTERHSLMALEKIFGTLLRTYETPDDLEAREAMLNASFEAGVAFTRVSVGYVHAIAHQLGGMFHTPHGVANAMLLPRVLDFYLRDELRPGHQDGAAPPGGGDAVLKRFLEMAKAAGLASHYKEHDTASMQRAALALVDRVRAMNGAMQVPQTVPEMKASDVQEVARRALNEAHGEQFKGVSTIEHIMDLGYPVPKYMHTEECEAIIAEYLEPSERAKWAASRSVPVSKL